jgi:hypothetical protein
MVSRPSDWRGELGRWLKPFLDRLGHKARRQMCPLSEITSNAAAASKSECFLMIFLLSRDFSRQTLMNSFGSFGHWAQVLSVRRGKA